MIEIDKLVEIWTRVHKDDDDDLSWWGEAMQHLRPTAEDVSDPPESDPDDQG